MTNKIIIKGAKEHNLKNIDLELPRDKLIVITGLSGSGKSSLAFDTIYAEGQRRYVESLSAYARQFLGRLEKPEVEYISGLSPAIAIEQRKVSKNPRSTVGTITEIYDYLRLLFAHVGKPHCYLCGRPIKKQSSQEIINQISSLPTGLKIQIMAPLVRGRKGEYKELFNKVKKDGYVRVRVDGKIYDLEEELSLDKNRKHTIEVVVDRLVLKEGIKTRLADSIETALKVGEGIVNILRQGQVEEELLFSEHLACLNCQVSIEEISPRMFSFNSPYGACPTCDGLGHRMEIDPDLLIPDHEKPLDRGGISAWGLGLEGWLMEQLRMAAEHFGFSLSKGFKHLSCEEKKIVLFGTDSSIKFTYKSKDRKSTYSWVGQFEGIINNLSRRYKQTSSEAIRSRIEKYMSILPCPECQGARLRKESLAVRINDISISQITKMSVVNALSFFKNLSLTASEKLIASQILKEITARLNFLVNVGLSYLTLDRKAGTLSGGEAQRIRLATQVGSGLVGVLYVLDEPSIGLHQRDNKKLLDTLFTLRDLGNTLIVVEHDETTIRSADYIVDLGPGAGEEGGHLVAAGGLKKILSEEASLTGKYLKGELVIPLPKRRKRSKKSLLIKGAEEHNLKKIDVEIPLGLFTCITGVSGSGKSTLISQTLYPALASRLHRAHRLKPGKFAQIKGIEHLDKVINIDQSPIGRTPRSNPATYTGVWTPIRELFSSLPESRLRGHKPGRFSFNLKGGRCEACQGDGIIKIEMHFLPDVYIPCEVCKGKRYNEETLQIRYKGKNITEVLEMTVGQAQLFFKNIPAIKRHLKTLMDVGLDYIKLGQSAITLSGGEAQRVKLSTELSKRATGRTIYFLDEPTTGLHFADVKKLLDVLFRLTAAKNTVVVIEHNLDVIKSADHIIDLGPEGGEEEGGRVVAFGPPEEIVKVSGSYTGRFLKKVLDKQEKK